MKNSGNDVGTTGYKLTVYNESTWTSNRMIDIKNMIIKINGRPAQFW